MLLHIKKKKNFSQHLYKVLKMSLPSVITWRIQLPLLKSQIVHTYNLYMLTILAIKTVTGEAHIGGDCVHLVYNLRRAIRL